MREMSNSKITHSEGIRHDQESVDRTSVKDEHINTNFKIRRCTIIKGKVEMGKSKSYCQEHLNVRSFL